MLHVNPSDAWLRSTAAVLAARDADIFAPRRIYLDKDCEIFALVSPEDFAFASQWRWKWNFDRTKQKRYAIRCTLVNGRRSTVYLHKEICGRIGAPPSEQHTIGDHINGQSLDCTRENMRWATLSENRRNRARGK